MDSEQMQSLHMSRRTWLRGPRVCFRREKTPGVRRQYCGESGAIDHRVGAQQLRRQTARSRPSMRPVRVARSC